MSAIATEHRQISNRSKPAPQITQSVNTSNADQRFPPMQQNSNTDLHKNSVSRSKFINFPNDKIQGGNTSLQEKFVDTQSIVHTDYSTSAGNSKCHRIIEPDVCRDVINRDLSGPRNEFGNNQRQSSVANQSDFYPADLSSTSNENSQNFPVETNALIIKDVALSGENARSFPIRSYPNYTTASTSSSSVHSPSPVCPSSPASSVSSNSSLTLLRSSAHQRSNSQPSSLSTVNRMPSKQAATSSTKSLATSTVPTTANSSWWFFGGNKFNANKKKTEKVSCFNSCVFQPSLYVINVG